MLQTVIVILIILWLLGYVTIPGLIIPRITLFRINRFPITLWDLLIFILICWIVDILPSPFRQIAALLLVLWTLSVLGLFAIPGLSNLLVVVMIVGLIVYSLSSIA